MRLCGNGSSRKPCKVFVLTDGYSTCGMRLTESLARAEEQNVQLVGLAVGMDKTFTESCYKTWLKVALPTALPEAVRAGSTPASGASHKRCRVG